MQSSYLLAQLEAAPHRKGQQLEKEESEYSTIPCFCSSPASSTLTNTTNFGSSFGSTFSDDTTSIFVLDNDGGEQFNHKIGRKLIFDVNFSTIRIIENFKNIFLPFFKISRKIHILNIKFHNFLRFKQHHLTIITSITSSRTLYNK